ncbi:hypothetical protein I316_06414 [Kwoniella heveanensis BCC8398]|uniref:Uncharacterized protein n=1 Tax=Kwoniella heveanensis BCC8398 TaxID=1296120 RepID=A0A1B9GL95_9TREE|nr:hypothetical protein I316_06414 [Kwoniella heveanensis BCC8398]
MRLTSPTSPRSSFGSSSNSSSRIASRHPITSSSSSSSSSSRRSSYALSTYKIWTSIPTIFVLPIPFLALLVSYLWAVGRRPEIPEQARIDDPHQWGYPNWYGRHPSPYDHGVKLNREDEEVCEHPKKVMLFIDLQPGSPEIPKALTALSSLSTSPRFNLTGVISPFSPNWVQDDSALNNLVRNGCEDVDWIWRISGDRGRIGKTTTVGGDEPEYIDDFDSDGGGASDGEGKEGTRISGSEKRRACGNASWVQDGETEGAALGSMDVTLLAQPHDMLKPEASHHALKANHGDTWEMGLFGHVMPAAK